MRITERRDQRGIQLSKKSAASIGTGKFNIHPALCETSAAIDFALRRNDAFGEWADPFDRVTGGGNVDGERRWMTVAPAAARSDTIGFLDFTAARIRPRRSASC